MAAHRKWIIAGLVLALAATFGLWRSAKAASDGALAAITGNWHLTQVSDRHVSAAPTNPTSLDFSAMTLGADDGTNHAAMNLTKATKQQFFISGGSVVLVGYPVAKDARASLSRAPLQQLLSTRDAITYTKTSAHQLVLRSDGYTYTLVK